MCFRPLKFVAVAAIGTAIAGTALFGREACSYFRASADNVRTAVKDNIPVEFELQRAQTLVDEIVPEMHANLRMIAEQEVQIEKLKDDIAAAEKRLGEQRGKVAWLRDQVADNVAVSYGGVEVSHQQAVEDLSQRVERFREAQQLVDGQKALLSTRQQTLNAAINRLEKTRGQKAQLEQQIAHLASQHELIKAAAVGADGTLDIDSSKLAQTERALGQIKHRLDVAERLLVHEARFAEPDITVPTNEHDVLADADALLGDRHEEVAAR